MSFTGREPFAEGFESEKVPPCDFQELRERDGVGGEIDALPVHEDQAVAAGP